MTTTPDYNTTELGMLFRRAWIHAIKRHHPSTPSPSSTAPWNDMPDWEQRTAEHVCARVIELIRSSGEATTKLQAFERGQLLTAMWNAHVHRFHPDPPASYTTPWQDLAAWRRQVNTEVFEQIQWALHKSDV
jgi:hypothetical protein